MGRREPHATAHTGARDPDHIVITNVSDGSSGSYGGPVKAGNIKGSSRQRQTALFLQLSTEEFHEHS
jgi:hypothetical protein